MAKRRKRRDDGPLPPPLPPETRTVGQLVAESIRLYGDRFWVSLPLGLGLALTFQLVAGYSYREQVPRFWLAAPLLTASFVGASAIAGKTRLTGRSALTAFVAGLVVFLPAPVLFGIFLLPGVAWLALFGLVVPVAVIERTGFRETFLRARRLATADYAHALGSLATLALVFFLSVLLLAILLRDQGDQTTRGAAFIAHLLLSPLVFLGAALLYFDQAARVKSGSRSRRRSHADVRASEHADPARHPDAEVEP
jgi:hypothetical protein